MRELHPDFQAALNEATQRGIVPRKLMTVTGVSFPDGNGNVTSERLSFWSDDDTVDITVRSGLNNQISTRKFYGGVNLEVGNIVRSQNLVVQTVTVQMTAYAPAVEQLVRGVDIRLARVEIWDALLDPKTRLMRGEPALAMLGVIDGSPISTEAVDGAEVVELKVVNEMMMMLTRTNPAKSSHEEQKKRVSSSGAVDNFGKYAGTTGVWKIPWGQK